MGTQNRVRQPYPQATDQASSAGSPAEQEPTRDNGTWRKFAEPRGWAVKWDGFALPGVRERPAENAQASTAEAD